MTNLETSIAKNLLREQQAVANDLKLTPDNQERYRLWCDPNSPYSCKLRTYLNYKGIPYQRMRVNLEAYNSTIVEKVGMSIMPVIITPLDHVMQDTTPIMTEFEQVYKDHSCTPADARLAFIMTLLEDFGDEYLTRFSMHYRWGNEINRTTLSHRLARSMSYGNVNLHAQKVAPMILGRQSAFDGPLGLKDKAARDSLDTQLIDLLNILDKHFEQHQFLLGDRPSLADFAIYGHVYAHLYQDPYSAAIMEQYGSRTCNWMDTITEFGDNRGLAAQTEFGDWLNLDEGNHTTLEQLLNFVGKTYIPFAAGTALAASLGNKVFRANIYDLDVEFSTFQYRAWSFENVQKAYDALSTDHQQWLQPKLTAAQVLPGLMKNGMLHCNLFDGFNPPFVKDGTCDARVSYLKEKKSKKQATKSQAKEVSHEHN
ncbi:MAG: glutathione S-transferase family protein [Bermanella sp.]